MPCYDQPGWPERSALVGNVATCMGRPSEHASHWERLVSDLHVSTSPRWTHISVYLIAFARMGWRGCLLQAQQLVWQSSAAPACASPNTAKAAAKG